MKNEQLAHVWASGSAASGYGSHFSFEGNNLYSYSTRVAVKIPEKEAVLITNNKYSVSTSTQVNMAEDATTHLNQFRVKVFATNAEGNRVNVLDYMERIDAILRKIPRARDCKSSLEREAQNLVSELEKYMHLFGFNINRLPKDKREKLARWSADKAGMCTPEELARLAAMDKAEQDKALRAVNRELKDWQRGAVEHLTTNASTALKDIVLLRVKGKDVQTSRGAYVPAKAARIMYKAWAAGRNIHGLQIGHFTITSANKEQVKINCHLITAEEINRLAKLEGWAAK